jgi:hypothetical protein
MHTSSFGSWEKMSWEQLINMYKMQQAWEKETKNDDLDTKNNTMALCKHESMIRHIYVNQ